MPNTLGPALNTYFGGNLKSANPGYILFEVACCIRFIQNSFSLSCIYILKGNIFSKSIENLSIC